MPSMSITYTASEGNRFAAALGKAQNLRDGDGKPRSATTAECKTFIIGRMKQLVIDVEGRDLTEAAIAAVVVPAFDPS
jgi:hypothetical protein